MPAWLAQQEDGTRDPSRVAWLTRLPLFEGWKSTKLFILSKGIAKVFTTNWIAAGVSPPVHFA